MLESPSLYAWYPYAYRCWQRIWNFSLSSSFEIIQIWVILPKMQFLCEFFKKLVNIFLSVQGEVICNIYWMGLIMWLSDHPRKWKYRWRGADDVISHWQFWKRIVCYFSYPSTPPTLLMLESPSLYAWYPYAYRCWQHIWTFSPSSSFKIIQIWVILPKNAISLWIIHEIVLKNVYGGGGGVIYIIYQQGFIMWLSDHPQKSKYWWRGRRMQFLIDNFERKLFVTSVTHHTIDARIDKHACMVPLSVVIVATYLKFVSNFPFW